MKGSPVRVRASALGFRPGGAEGGTTPNPRPVSRGALARHGVGGAPGGAQAKQPRRPSGAVHTVLPSPRPHVPGDAHLQLGLPETPVAGQVQMTFSIAPRG